MNMAAGVKDVKMTMRYPSQPDFAVLGTSVFNLSFAERKFIHIGCTWLSDRYSPVVIIISPSMYFWMDIDKFINFLQLIDEVISFMDESCKSKIYLNSVFNIVKSKCFSKSYLSISGKGSEEEKMGRISLTEKNLFALKEMKSCLLEVTKEKYETCNLLYTQSKEVYEKVKDLVINKFLVLPENLMYSIVKSMDISLLPKTSTALYKEIVTFDYKCIIKRIWEQFIEDFKHQTNQDVKQMTNENISKNDDQQDHLENHNENVQDDNVHRINNDLSNPFNDQIQIWENCNDLFG
ncbi:uncharacterized protein LOC126896609 [Daktulosphaira vitifoliae]|uniref:uncharacterized protein LOC126896609 n=1 Tax=Daktulosphaira vitifoliae TaxID=58002 RepID=UPI0021AA8D95|nr:uncharacterized protein LOC126896609 [Daktulosphaira vitifoliae]